MVVVSNEHFFFAIYPQLSRSIHRHVYGMKINFRRPLIECVGNALGHMVAAQHGDHPFDAEMITQ